MKLPNPENPFPLLSITLVCTLAVIGIIYAVWHIGIYPVVSGQLVRDEIQGYLKEPIPFDQLEHHHLKIEKYEMSQEWKNQLRDHYDKHSPDSQLRYFDAPKEVWEGLGGARGYAIVKDGELKFLIKTTIN